MEEILLQEFLGVLEHANYFMIIAIYTGCFQFGIKFIETKVPDGLMGGL